MTLSERERLPPRRAHEVLDLEHGGFRFTVGLGRFGDGRLAEVFITSKKSGTALDVVLRDSAILLSFALQFGVSVQTIRHALTRNVDGTAAGPVGALLDKIEAERPAPITDGRHFFQMENSMADTLIRTKRP